MQGKIKCSVCQNMIPIGPFCPFCGSEQVPQDKPGDGKKRRRNGNTVPIVKAGMDTTVPVKVSEPEPEKEDTGVSGKEEPVPAEEKQKTGKVDDNLEKTAEEDTEADRETGTEKNPDGSVDEGNMKLVNSLMKGVQEHKDRKSRKELEYDRTHDTLTGLYNHETYRKKMKETTAADAGIILCSVESLGSVKKQLGDIYADILVSSVAQALVAVFGDNCYRTGEDGFAVILSGINENVIRERILKFQTELKNREFRQAESGVQIDMKAAAGFGTGDGRMTMREIFECANQKLSAEKMRMKSVYNPNYDGYYNDVKAQYEELKVEIDRENIHKAVLVVIVFIITMIIYFMFL